MKTKICSILAALIIGGMSVVPPIETAAVGISTKTAIKYDEETDQYLSSGDTLSGVKLGDFNTDLSVDASDASMILAYYADVSTGKSINLSGKEQLADVNRDAVVDATDASAVLSYYAALMTTGATATWPKPKFDLRATYTVYINTPVFNTISMRETILPSNTNFKIEGSNARELHIYTVDNETTEVYKFSLLYTDNIIRVK